MDQLLTQYFSFTDTSELSENATVVSADSV